jgi:hypothetical protein
MYETVYSKIPDYQMMNLKDEAWIRSENEQITNADALAEVLCEHNLPVTEKLFRRMLTLMKIFPHTWEREATEMERIFGRDLMVVEALPYHEVDAR